MTQFIGPGSTGATFSDCRKYRWTLWRRWVPDCPPVRMCAFIGLNPSTADETMDDPTIRRCIRFSKDWGFGGYVMLNLFAYRATDPREMKRQADPVGILNNEAIWKVTLMAGQTIAAWGNHGSHMGRATEVAQMLEFNFHHLGITGQGEPKHPLYLRADTNRIPMLPY